MALHLVGETLDSKRAFQAAQAGDLIQMIRGVYVDAADDIDTTLLRHAVRIAAYLYPTAYLSSASSALLGPTNDGRLFISGRRNQRTRLRSLEIVQNEAPPSPSIVSAVVGDDLGELQTKVSSPRQRFLEAFRLRSEHASAVTEAMRQSTAERLIEEYGSATDAADAVWALARSNQWYREGEAAERYLLNRRSGGPVANRGSLELVVAWHGKPIGKLSHDGFEWRWRPAEAPLPPLVRQTTPGKLPPFIEALLPEGWLAKVLPARNERQVLLAGRRYMSNIAVVDNPARLRLLPQDVLDGRLADFTERGVFVGEYQGPGRDHLERSFETNLARIFADAETPRLSGVQIKAPMHLSRAGLLSPATHSPFTHILKPAGTSGFEALPVVEWTCLQLGEAARLETARHALIPMPEGMAPALLVERFDIRRDASDRRRLALEDFCSVLDLPTTAKYDGTIERMAKGLRALSTSAQSDLVILFQRALFAWLIADGDMHLKNVALLKIAAPRGAHFSTVRMAPLYDAVTTRVFPGLEHDRMALKLNGKDARLTRQDFLALARTMEIPVTLADETISSLSARVHRAAEAIRLPALARNFKGMAAAVHRVQEIVVERCDPLI